MLMLDTNIFSELRERKRLHVSAWFAGLSSEVCISAVTVSELQFGASKVAARRRSFATELEVWLDGIIAKTRVIPVGAEAARLLGRMQSEPALLQLARDPPEAPRFGSDIGIAATAIVAGCAIATLNLRHFRLIGRHFPALVVVDPLGSHQEPR